MNAAIGEKFAALSAWAKAHPKTALVLLAGAGILGYVASKNLKTGQAAVPELVPTEVTGDAAGGSLGGVEEIEPTWFEQPILSGLLPQYAPPPDAIQPSEPRYVAPIEVPTQVTTPVTSAARVWSGIGEQLKTYVPGAPAIAYAPVSIQTSPAHYGGEDVAVAPSSPGSGWLGMPTYVAPAPAPAPAPSSPGSGWSGMPTYTPPKTTAPRLITNRPAGSSGGPSEN